MATVTINLDDKIMEAIEDKLNEQLPKIIEELLQENTDELIKDIVIKQLRSCALIYIQSPDFRAKMLEKVKPKVNEIVGIE